MTAPAMSGPVSTYVRDRLIARLRERRVVVWYDPHRHFAGFVDELQLPETTVVSAARSALRARREAEIAYRQLQEGAATQAESSLLIYVPAAYELIPEIRQEDPFAGFAGCGAVFGAQEGESLRALAIAALPAQEAAISRLFREGQPTLALLDRLRAGALYPLVRQALGSESVVDALSMALSDPEAGVKLVAVPGSLPELVRLAAAGVGLPERTGEEWPAWRSRLATYLLVSELALDLPGGLPAALSSVPHAEEIQTREVTAICERLRATDAGRDAYIALATAAEQALRLPAILTGEQSARQSGSEAAVWGARDTFAIQERLRLRVVVAAALRGDLAGATAIQRGAARSIWRRQPERKLLWYAAGCCVDFLIQAADLETRALPRETRALIEAYTSAEGLWRLDRAQRLYEHADTQCEQSDEIEDLVGLCRSRYRAVAERGQTIFQDLVRRGGWPPEGLRRQTQIFDHYVAPELVEHRRVAYFLVDSLRYEMGRDLADSLRDLGEVALDAAATVLPTKTPCGMAALMPGADGAYTFVEHKGEAAPAIGGVPLPSISERRALLDTKYRDRLADITLEELRTASRKRLAKLVEVADLLIVRTQDIDEMGEGSSIYRARKVMTEILGELRAAATRLTDLGFQTLVFAADHGHMLLPEVPAGDALPTPSGDWLLKTRRSLLGRAHGAPSGVLRLSARDVGIIGPIDDYVTASGFRTFKDGAGYFHEGLSLQECVVPVVTARLQQTRTTGGGEQVAITYRSERFTSAVISLKVLLSNASLLSAALAVRVEAFDGGGLKARVVGLAADCDARNPATGEIVLRAGVEAAVPLVIDNDFSGSKIEVRAADPRTGAVLARLTLKNDRMV
ncbi:MAG TPA: PglZ domain-containing protein [Chloroflexota bacterium]|nr:PglZ domain-containing protein [Chloroflexota bacterium]